MKREIKLYFNEIPLICGVVQCTLKNEICREYQNIESKMISQKILSQKL